MFAAIARWLLGGGISAIGEQLNRAHEARLNARNDHERVEADMLIATLRAQQAVLVAEQGSWMTRWIRPAFALPFIIYNFKIIVWDKVLGWGITDPLSPHFMYLEIAIFGAYFLTRGLERKRR
jgi:hypothetical protein